MTTGVTGQPFAPAYTNGLTGTWSYREWTGTDGKYTGGSPNRLKWNNYQVYQDTMTIACCQTRFFCPFPGGGGDPSTNYTPSVYRQYPPDAAFGNLNNDILKTLGRLAEKAKGHSWNMAVDLAQSKMTVDMVTGALGSLGRAFMATKHGDFSGALRQLGATPRGSSWKTLDSRDVSGRWLEIQYGWLPTLSSVYEASKAYHAMTDGPRAARFASGLSPRSVIWQYGHTSSAISTQKFSFNRQYVLELWESMSAPRELGLTDPLSVAWELVPYSFVVDWFVPIGTYLSDLNQLATLQGRWLVLSRTGPEGKVSWDWPGGSATYPICGYHGGHRYQVMTHRPAIIRRAGYYSRISLNSPPSVPPPRITGLPEAVSPKRIFNAIALAHQRFVR